jgi:hypothetical protein
VKKRMTPEVLARLFALQKETPKLPNTLIAKRLGVHVSTVRQALKEAKDGSNRIRQNSRG